MAFAFQKPKATCFLNAAMPPDDALADEVRRTPLDGLLELRGAAWKTRRIRRRIGWA